MLLRPDPTVLVLLAVVPLVLAACGGPTSASPPRPARKPGPSPLAADFHAGVSHPGLAALLDDHAEAFLERNPVYATSLGDRRFDALLGDPSDAAVRRWREVDRALLARARALDVGALTAGERVTLELLIDEVEGDLEAGEACEAHLWSISARQNPVADSASVPQDHKVDSAEAAADLLARYRQLPAATDASIANLRLGASRGLVAGAETLRRTLELIDRELARPIDEWALMEPAKGEGPVALEPAARARFVAELREVVEREVKPAFVRFRAVVADELLPRGREGAAAGIGGLPIGARCYAAQIRKHTGLRFTAEELHALGLAEIARLDRAIAALGATLFGAERGKDLAATLATLRGDRSLYFSTREELLAAADAALSRARDRMPDYVGRIPATPCVVAEIPAYEAPFTYVAYYREPSKGSGKPGEYFVNTYKPEVRPRFEMEALSFHESIPGHHLQIALAHEQAALPLFRRYLGSTAFVEGWALYTEQLADELGLYSGDLDRMGMLSYDAWRAARLVVDTGIHALGWTREQAEQFMRDHTALTPENITNEVDRYLGWPGQALAYKVGQLEMWKLRREAEAQLGGRFDLRRFHDVVLENGAVTLPVLRRVVEAWIAAQVASTPPGPAAVPVR